MSHSYIVTARKLTGDAFDPDPEAKGGLGGKVRFIKVPRTARTYDRSHIVTANSWTEEVRGLADGDENPFSISRTGDVLVFVHGFNNSMQDVISRTNKLRAGLKAAGWRGEVVAFDWPSDTSVLNYLEDRADAASVARELVTSCLTLVAKGQEANCPTNIHLLGHSTGAYVILEAFAQAEKVGKLFKGDWRFGQVALIAGDIAADNLRAQAAWSQPMFKRIMRLTNYSNGFDAVLAVSNAKRLGVSPRAGRVGLPEGAEPKAVNVDCTPHYRTLKAPADQSAAFCHAWHFDDARFALDLAMTLEGAIDRHVIPTRDLVGKALVLNETGKRPEGMENWGIRSAWSGIY